MQFLSLQPAFLLDLLDSLLQLVAVDRLRRGTRSNNRFTFCFHGCLLRKAVVLFVWVTGNSNIYVKALTGGDKVPSAGFQI
jgi:hypothetical protein